MKTPTTLSIEYVNYSNKNQHNKNFKEKKRFAFWTDTSKYSFFELFINWFITLGSVIFAILTAVFIPIQVSRNNRAYETMKINFKPKYINYQTKAKEQLSDNKVFKKIIASDQTSQITFADAVVAELKAKIEKYTATSADVFYYALASNLNLKKEITFPEKPTQEQKQQIYKEESFKILDETSKNGIRVTNNSNQNYPPQFQKGSFYSDFIFFETSVNNSDIPTPEDFIKYSSDPRIAFYPIFNIAKAFTYKNNESNSLYNFYAAINNPYVEAVKVYEDYQHSVDSPFSILFNSPTSGITDMFLYQPFYTILILVWTFELFALMSKWHQCRKRKRRPWKYTPIEESPNNFKNWKKGIFKKNKNKEW